MQVENDVQEVINKVKSGKLNKLLSKLDGSDFGIQLPVYDDQGTIKMMLAGYSQVERDLIISVSRDNVDDDALQIGWFGSLDGKDSSCSHGNLQKCRHCTAHGGRCSHCTHTTDHSGLIEDAPKLDYFEMVEEIKNKQDILDELAPEGLGLTLIHGHSNKHMFTKLPEDRISVIVAGKTEFRLESDVAKDPTFVPNVWRVINGELKVSGGHSQQEDPIQPAMGLSAQRYRKYNRNLAKP